MKKYYLAYGSNLDTKAMALCCPNAKVVGTAMIDGYELMFKGTFNSSYLTIDKKDGGSVPVAVWEVDQEDERRLDSHERFPYLYYKTEMDITYTELGNDRQHTINAFVYVINEYFSPNIPSADYIRICFEDYENFGFDRRYITDAIGRSAIKEGSR